MDFFHGLLVLVPLHSLRPSHLPTPRFPLAEAEIVWCLLLLWECNRSDCCFILFWLRVHFL